VGLELNGTHQLLAYAEVIIRQEHKYHKEHKASDDVMMLVQE
jgi:hypothetical protein